MWVGGRQHSGLGRALPAPGAAHAIVPPEMEFEPDPYLPRSARRRLITVLLAVATAAGVVYLMTRTWGILRSVAPPPAAEVAACKPGETAGCVGSMTAVIVPAPAASAVSR